MMEERYHATTQNRFYPDMSNVNKNITVDAKLINPPTLNPEHYCKDLLLDSIECLTSPQRFVVVQYRI